MKISPQDDEIRRLLAEVYGSGRADPSDPSVVTIKAGTFTLADDEQKHLRDIPEGFQNMWYVPRPSVACVLSS